MKLWQIYGPIVHIQGQDTIEQINRNNELVQLAFNGFLRWHIALFLSDHMRIRGIKYLKKKKKKEYVSG